MSSPRTRGQKPTPDEPYPLGEFPAEVITAIGRDIIYRLAVGTSDIGGDGFGDIFAKAIGGRHFNSPEGVMDVSCGDCAWSVKTVKNDNPSKAEIVRLISGRNSPDYSYGKEKGVTEQETGNDVLGIWNERVRQAQAGIKGDLRRVVLMRDMDNLKFAIFEEELHKYSPGNYTWTKNKRNNLEGHEKGKHKFTWQPHGSQFTIMRDVPASAAHFALKRPPRVNQENVLKNIGYEENWIIRL